MPPIRKSPRTKKNSVNNYIDLTQDSDDGYLPEPHTSKERKGRKRNRGGNRASTNSSRQTTPSTTSSSTSVQSVHNNSFNKKGKERSQILDEENDENDERSPSPIDGHNVLTALNCPICFDSVTNACSTSCGHIACGQCLYDYFVGENNKRSQSLRSILPNHQQNVSSRSHNFNQSGRGSGRWKRVLRSARNVNNTAANIAFNRNLDRFHFEGPCPICRTELSGTWGEVIIPLYLRTFEVIE